MTNAPYLLTKARGGYRIGDGAVVDSMMLDGLTCTLEHCAMGEATERYAAELGLERGPQDAFAAASHERAARAQKDGLLAEEIAPARARDDVRREAGVGDDQRMVAVLPGSRRHEVEEHWPLFVETVRRLGPGVRAALAAAPGVDGAALAERARAGGLDVAVFDGQTYSLVAASDVALTVSGTATVECALLGCPMVVAYRMPASSFAVARRLVRVDAIAMPNLLLGRRAVPEFVQDEASPAALAAALRRFLDDPDHRRETIDALAGIRTQLVRPGAAERAADLLLETLGDR